MTKIFTRWYWHYLFADMGDLSDCFCCSYYEWDETYIWRVLWSRVVYRLKWLHWWRKRLWCRMRNHPYGTFRVGVTAWPEEIRCCDNCYEEFIR